jgi:hypothetical protein
MRLLRLSEVEIGLNDRVFRHARLRALLLWLAAFCGDAAMFFSAVTAKWNPGYIFCYGATKIEIFATDRAFSVSN